MKFRVLVLLLALFLLAGATPSPAPLPLSSAVPRSLRSPAPTPVPRSSPSPLVHLSGIELKTLLKQFKQAQGSELKALAHRHEFEMKELKASKNTRQREWERREKEARHQFFAEHLKGTERRTYISDYLKRYEALKKQFAEEKSQRDLEHKASWAALKQDQDRKFKEFKKYIEAQTVPPADLWPQPGI